MTTTNNKVMTTQEVGARFNELAQQEKWFEIQDEFFADNVRSIEPPRAALNPQGLQNAEGKIPVRKKGEDWGKRVEAVHRLSTTEPVVAGNHLQSEECRILLYKDWEEYQPIR